MTRQEAIAMVEAWIRVGIAQVEDRDYREEEVAGIPGFNVQVTTSVGALQELKRVLESGA